MQQNSEMIPQTQTDSRSQMIEEKHLLCLFVYSVVAPFSFVMTHGYGRHDTAAAIFSTGSLSRQR